jgi:hypothetical protein
MLRFDTEWPWGGTMPRIPDEDLGPDWLRDTVSINVEVDSLKTFAQALLADLEKNFGTHLPQVYEAMSIHACVGDGMFFPEMDAARTKHYECLDTAVNLLRDHAKGTFAMAKGAEVVAANYGDADTLAQVRVRDVEHVMNPPVPPGTPTAGPLSTFTTSTSEPVIVERGVQ